MVKRNSHSPYLPSLNKTKVNSKNVGEKMSIMYLGRYLHYLLFQFSQFQCTAIFLSSFSFISCAYWTQNDLRRRLTVVSEVYSTPPTGREGSVGLSVCGMGTITSSTNKTLCSYYMRVRAKVEQTMKLQLQQSSGFLAWQATKLGTEPYLLRTR